jgi:hypothetical protein
MSIVSLCEKATDIIFFSFFFFQILIPCPTRMSFVTRFVNCVDGIQNQSNNPRIFDLCTKCTERATGSERYRFT